MTATAQRFLHTEGGYHPSITARPTMNYIELINRFWQLDAEERVADYATRLYFFLLQECNRRRWVNPFDLSDKQLIRIMGGSVNTLKKHREDLAQRGLISYQSGGKGRGDSCVYALQMGEPTAPLKVSIIDTIPVSKVSNADTLPVQKVSTMVSNSDTIIPEKVSGMVSNSDTYIYKEDKTKTSSVVKTENKGGKKAADAAAPAPVVEEVSEPVQAQFDKWKRWAQKNAPRVLKMKVPVTAAELDRLVKKYGGSLVLEIFSEMDNWEPLTTKRRYAAKTCATWCNNRKNNPLPATGRNGAPAAPTRISGNYAAPTQPQKIR